MCRYRQTAASTSTAAATAYRMIIVSVPSSASGLRTRNIQNLLHYCETGSLRRQFRVPVRNGSGKITSVRRFPGECGILDRNGSQNSFPDKIDHLLSRARSQAGIYGRILSDNRASLLTAPLNTGSIQAAPSFLRSPEQCSSLPLFQIPCAHRTARYRRCP